uniref:BZIP domain-containing protein n=1 Tax=Parascaris univalens TaxID=6257 RepID=A0A915CI78_PARUN
LMDDEWTPIVLKDDYLFSAVACASGMPDISLMSTEEEADVGNFTLTGVDQHLDTATPKQLSEFSLQLAPINTDHFAPTASDYIKREPRDDGSSDNHASFSASPCSSSFSSPEQDNKDVNMDGIGAPLFHHGMTTVANTTLSNTRMGYGFRSNDTLTLPPVSQFSHSTTQSYFDSNIISEAVGSPSPPSSDRSSPMEPAVYGAPTSTYRTRSKMHEMAVKQKLITDQDPRGNGFVQLSSEEKRTLLQEGYSVPTRLPLSKAEEEALKVVRRKIKNKLSAQESRRKRKEYMDALEQKVQGYYNENTALKAKVRQLEQANRGLVMQLKKMQTTLSGQPSVHNSPCFNQQIVSATHIHKL